MTRQITETDCDNCVKTNVPVKTFKIVTHRRPDAAGGPSDDAGYEFDLCIDCMESKLRKYFDTMTTDKQVVASTIKHIREF